MKNERWNKIEEKIKTISIIVSLLITIGGVVIGLFNYYTLNQLAPVSARIKQVEANQAVFTEKLATKEELEVISAKLDSAIVRIDRISSRVDLLINHLIQ